MSDITPADALRELSDDQAEYAAAAAKKLGLPESVERKTHFLIWTHDMDCVRVEATCTADEGATCRLTCADPDCEAEAYTIERRLDDTSYHVYGEDDDGDEIFHDMKDGGFCNVCEFLNGGGCIEEEAVDTPPFIIGSVPIEPVWQGDYYSWKRAEVTP